MKGKQKVPRKTQELFEGKERYHKDLARLPFEEKIEILVKLQKMANELRNLKGQKERRVWKIK